MKKINKYKFMFLNSIKSNIKLEEPDRLKQVENKYIFILNAINNNGGVNVEWVENERMKIII